MLECICLCSTKRWRWLALERMWTEPVDKEEMKFGKRLASQMEETIPEWRDKFLSYKQLKKRLKLMSAPECFTEAAFENGNSSPVCETTSAVDVAVDELEKFKNTEQQAEQQPNNNPPPATEEEAEFTKLLEVELEKFNSFFTEKEEEYVIRLQELKDRIEQLKIKAQGTEESSTGFDIEHHEELIQIRKDIVTFHGEMVLLLNYSSLNYTGLVKILKKYDKRTGMSLRLPFIQRVLHQPFFTTELLSKLVEECESNLQSIFPVVVNVEETEPSKAHQVKEPSQPEEELEEGERQSDEVERIYRSTMAALQTIKDLRKGSSTYSPFSLPPIKDET